MQELILENPVMCTRCKHMEFWVEAKINCRGESTVIFTRLVCNHCGNKIILDAYPSLPPMEEGAWGHA